MEWVGGEEGRRPSTRQEKRRKPRKGKEDQELDKTREKRKKAKKRKRRPGTEPEEEPSLRKENWHQMRLAFLTVTLVLVQGVNNSFLDHFNFDWSTFFNLRDILWPVINF